MHIASTAPAFDFLKNDAHIKAMAQVVKSLLAAIDQQEAIREQKQDLVTLFIAVHELVKYVNEKSILFTAETSLNEVFTRMFEHAETRLDKEIPLSLGDKELHYRQLFNVTSDTEVLNYYEEGGLDEIPEAPAFYDRFQQGM